MIQGSSAVTDYFISWLFVCYLFCVCVGDRYLGGEQTVSLPALVQQNPRGRQHGTVADRKERMLHDGWVSNGWLIYLLVGW